MWGRFKEFTQGRGQRAAEDGTIRVYGIHGQEGKSMTWAIKMGIVGKVRLRAKRLFEEGGVWGTKRQDGHTGRDALRVDETIVAGWER